MIFSQQNGFFVLDTWFWPVINNTPTTLLIIEHLNRTRTLIVLRQGFKLRIIIRIAGWLSGDLCDIITTFVMYIHVFNCAINSSFCDTFVLKLTKNLLEGLEGNLSEFRNFENSKIFYSIFTEKLCCLNPETSIL